MTKLSPREIDYWTADPEDIEIQWAHRWLDTDDWDDPAVLCRNGCGISYLDAVCGKVTVCQALPDDSWEARMTWWRETRGW